MNMWCVRPGTGCKRSARRPGDKDHSRRNHEKGKIKRVILMPMTSRDSLRGKGTLRVAVQA